MLFKIKLLTLIVTSCLATTALSSSVFVLQDKIDKNGLENGGNLGQERTVYLNQVELGHRISLTAFTASVMQLVYGRNYYYQIGSGVANEMLGILAPGNFNKVPFIWNLIINTNGL